MLTSREKVTPLMVKESVVEPEAVAEGLEPVRVAEEPPVAVAVLFEPGLTPPATELLTAELVPMMLELPVPIGTGTRVDSWLEALLELLKPCSWRRYATLAEARLESDRAATAAEMKEGIIIVVECCC